MQKCLNFTCKCRKTKGLLATPPTSEQNGKMVNAVFPTGLKEWNEKRTKHGEFSPWRKCYWQTGSTKTKISVLKGSGPVSHPCPLSLADACGPNAYGSGSSENALSPLEGPTVCQGAQGAQWTLVNAFQESGGGERGGEVEGGLALRNAARSWGDGHGTG